MDLSRIYLAVNHITVMKSKTGLMTLISPFECLRPHFNVKLLRQNVFKIAFCYQTSLDLAFSSFVYDFSFAT